MIAKIKLLVSSIRFWIFTLGAVAGFLATVDASGFSLANLLTAVTAWATVIAGTGSLDKWFKKA